MPTVEIYERPYNLINGQIAQMLARADSSLAAANASIAALQSLVFEPRR